MGRISPFVWFILVLTSLITAVTAAQTTVWVDDDCVAPGTGTPGDPFCAIQDAICNIEGTGGGDVMVSPGTYNESLRMFPGVSVVSTDGPAVTTIDATGRPCTRLDCLPSTANLTCSVVVYGTGVLSTDRLEGFHITGGDGIFRDFGPTTAVVGGGDMMTLLLTGMGLGLAILVRPWARRAAIGIIAVSLGYLFAGTIWTPDLWADPLGPFMKVTLGIALALMVAGMLEER